MYTCIRYVDKMRRSIGSGLWVVRTHPPWKMKTLLGTPYNFFLDHSGCPTQKMTDMLPQISIRLICV